ncbi:hypothetical protein RvY_18703 [Ramazzottius varieornatus]|uniref:Uncharacterized protein n=1 Tax=Ramazzottius varieornatus TaxID=947166 RepID=A0A1D1W703_RAMVA|nr:hypothetical protein RvY_18703 [Ramazzottius varieornatus]
MASKIKSPTSANESSANKKPKIQEGIDIHAATSALSQPSISSSGSSPETTVQLQGIDPFCFGSDGKQLPKINSCFHVVNASNTQEPAGKNTYRYILTDKKESMNLLVWGINYVVPGIQNGWLSSGRTVMHYEGAAVHRVSVNLIPSSETEP